VFQALQLVLPTPQAQLEGSLPRCTTLGSVESEYHSRKRLMTSTVAPATRAGPAAFPASFAPEQPEDGLHNPGSWLEPAAWYVFMINEWLFIH
jgi:hypothetical protein